MTPKIGVNEVTETRKLIGYWGWVRYAGGKPVLSASIWLRRKGNALKQPR